MRATISRYINALKQRRSSDEGFSLIELIVVVAILGILVAIAIPVFGSIQQSAKTSALATIAANGATQVASQLATDPTQGADDMDFSNLETDDISLALDSDDPLTIDNYCVTASQDGVDDQSAGPACP